MAAKVAKGARARATEPAAPERPAWLVPTSLGLAVLGLLVSIYMTYEHFTGNTSLACPATGPFDCVKVTSSEWSSMFGIPVAVLGLVFFIVTLALCLPAMWRKPGRQLDRIRLAWLTIGLITALYLVWAELFRIHSICLWCTAVHIITFILLVVVLFGQILSDHHDD